ncbi:hypothetical protein R1sor_006418 [Riccia sorocarpa]|uniref:Reverse transcriptase domain-containing protein n=1 Tax=Riccia sorocarpa TaxID=122646 RepID=A0ABD3HQC4_9MARC
MGHGKNAKQGKGAGNGQKGATGGKPPAAEQAQRSTTGLLAPVGKEKNAGTVSSASGDGKCDPATSSSATGMNLDNDGQSQNQGPTQCRIYSEETPGKRPLEMEENHSYFNPDILLSTRTVTGTPQNSESGREAMSGKQEETQQTSTDESSDKQDHPAATNLEPEEEIDDGNQDETFIDRHPTWAHVTAENLEKLRKNPAWEPVDESYELDLETLIEDIEEMAGIDEVSGGSDGDKKPVESDILFVNSRALGFRIKQLKERSLVIHTVDKLVLLPYFENWATELLEQKLGVHVEKICQMGRFCFHVTVASGLERNHIFANSPLPMGNAMVFPLPWDSWFSMKDLRTRAVPVWIELHNVRIQNLELGIEMLKMIGPVLYATKNAETLRTTLIKGCVLVNLSKPLIEVIRMAIPEAPSKIWRQKVHYPRLPDACFVCHQRGHIARYCPINRDNQVPSDGGVNSTAPRAPRPQMPTGRYVGQQTREVRIAEGGHERGRGTNRPNTDAESFTQIRRRRSRSKPKYRDPEGLFRKPIENRFRVLQDNDQEDAEMEVEKPANSSKPASNLEGGPSTSQHTNPSSPRRSTLPGGSTNSDSQDVELQRSAGRKHGTDPQRRRESTTVGVRDSIAELRKKPRNKENSSSYENGDIIGLQELKCGGFELQQTLQKAAKGGFHLADTTANGWARAALIIKPHITVLDSGTRGGGTAVWAKIQTSKGIVGFLSIYAPHEDGLRHELWRWIRDLIQDGQWVLLGDMNYVELPEDSYGPSPFLHGREERIWKRLARERDLVDAYLVAADRLGPPFTRYQVKIDRIEMARLDRRKWKSYFKMHPRDMADGETKLKVKESWETHPNSANDPRVKWDLAWKRVKNVLKEARRNRNKSRLTREELCQLVTAWRSKVTAEDSAENRAGYQKALDQLRTYELEEAEKWRVRSRATWMRAGDAPTRYFFALWKAKVKKEEINILQKLDGSQETSKKGILDMIGDYYKSLFQEEGESPESIELRSQVLQRVDKKVDEEASLKLIQTPLSEEIDRRVRELAKEKSPGLDGITAEMLWENWSLVQADLKEVIWAFWQDNRLSHPSKKGVIKLIAKSHEISKLTNYRPITLLGITYKIISKILAERLQEFMPQLVSAPQTGFIPGRVIFDNILALHLSQDWVNRSGQEALFLKLDFTKAYDRVRHIYLWDTLCVMNFSEKFIALVQGLCQDATATVSVNGDFTQEFKMEWGVRQGCPLAPFLFALTTEPLMRLLQEANDRGQIKGVMLPNGKQMIQSLFADDTGLYLQADERNFRRVKRLIEIYEQIAGAKLNVEKSLLIPMGMEVLPRWLFLTGCKIAARDEVFTYLGTPVGLALTEEQKANFVVDRVAKRIFHWSTRLLSWESRCVLLKHAITSVPSYALMTLGLTESGYKALDTLCRHFLWGKREDGVFRKPLIGWRYLCSEKDEGGIGLITFRDQSMAQKMSLTIRLLHRDTADWCTVAEALILDDFNSKRINRNKSRSMVEILFAETCGTFRSSKTLTHLLKGWKCVRPQLCLASQAMSRPETLTLDFLIAIGLKEKIGTTGDWTCLRRWIKAYRITDLANLTRHSLNLIWADRAGNVRQASGNVQGPIRQTTWFLLQWAAATPTQELHIVDPSLWCWKDSPQALKSLSLSTRDWRRRISKPPLTDRALNRKWHLQWSHLEWKQLWKNLWKALMHPRDKLWLWKCLNLGFFTRAHAHKIGVSTPECQRCGSYFEDLSHIFFDCTKAKRRWEEVKTKLRNAHRTAPQTISLPHLLASQLSDDADHLTFRSILISHTRLAWRERCDFVFDRRDGAAPIQTIIQEAKLLVSSLLNSGLGQKRTQITEEAVIRLEELMIPPDSRDRSSPEVSSPTVPPRNDLIPPLTHTRVTETVSTEGSTRSYSTGSEETRPRLRQNLPAVESELEALGFCL